MFFQFELTACLITKMFSDIILNLFNEGRFQQGKKIIEIGGAVSNYVIK